MNHAGEIAPLAEMVRPHVALITTVEPVHLGYFASVEAIAEAKAEIFAGLVPGGTRRAAARQPALSPCCASARRRRRQDRHLRLSRRGRLPRPAGRCRPQGLLGHRRPRLAAVSLSRRRARASTTSRTRWPCWRRCSALGADAMRCLPALARVSAPVGPGRRTLLDVARRPDSADRRELQRQSGLGAGGAGRHGHHAARGLSAPRRRAGRHAGAGRRVGRAAPRAEGSG